MNGTHFFKYKQSDWLKASITGV